ncbi:hypothetical protein TVAG_184450 [Trichomonas vaginalis G3]|uniref:Uncharacterized protein n=1 Tax=Trichomonas vaginalis (strain ATCC PRA-98 / G3) TaxID=412133 RepID=A2E9Y1_TRIV3|nr:hypothetical protein TVAGG3_0181080 [Trichomonas vaginalis G3]EAY10543.1 hypothetical protein TVAG_184450 [Trichomonas vaginalis G3]KAI5549294.1 hypothetical protein TVAGG3_0181080 [Trichomonas vaginalis G3]|eukprot:XP_001322766.1 hypothetical protein [Trichomonas vaginalis G3]
MILFFIFALLVGSAGPQKPDNEKTNFEDYEKLKKEGDKCPDTTCPKEKPQPKYWDPAEEFTL